MLFSAASAKAYYPRTLNSPFGGNTMKAAILYAVALVIALLSSFFLVVARAAPVAAAFVYEDGSAKIVLSHDACKNADLAQELLAAVPGSAVKFAEVTYKDLGGILVKACWAVEGEKVILADEMGNAGFILHSAFKPVYAF